MDSGLPHEDVTPPRSDSFSTVSSSASPPDQSNSSGQSDMKEQHRKSNSLDEINLNNQGQRQGSQSWKSYSLQRQQIPVGQEVPVPQPPPSNGNSSQIYANPNPTLAIRRPGLNAPVIQDDEDPYGRCMNMKLTSFSEQQQQQQAQIRDPRIIDLNPAGIPTQQSQHPNFNTLPGSHVHQPEVVPNTVPHGGVQGVMGSSHNTLPARVAGPSGRHFKPFDHRKMNPMADIQENPYGPPAPYASGQSTYPQGHDMNNGNLVVKSNVHPNLPPNLRHTNVYSGPGMQQKPVLVNPKVLDHRDSANYSLGSSDSG